MNNIELLLKFEEIYFIENAFDKIIALKGFKKEYKQTEFYKQTKIKLMQAYKLFEANQNQKALKLLSRLTDTEYISTLITEYLNGIDSDTINNLLDKIINAFNIENIEGLKGELQQAITSLKG